MLSHYMFHCTYAMKVWNKSQHHDTVHLSTSTLDSLWYFHDLFLKIAMNSTKQMSYKMRVHDDVIKWKYFPRYWPFVRGIHRSPVNSPHKGQWRGALMFSLICTRINSWVNNREAGDLKRNRAHYDVTVMTRSGTTEYTHKINTYGFV